MGTQRQRLPPTVRVGQILDAALQEFSAAGYAGARMDAVSYTHLTLPTICSV